MIKCHPARFLSSLGKADKDANVWQPCQPGRDEWKLQEHGDQRVLAIQRETSALENVSWHRLTQVHGSLPTGQSHLAFPSKHFARNACYFRGHCF